MSDRKTQYDNLFKQYLDVCNQALEKNKNKFPYKEVWGATESLMDDVHFNVAIYDDRPQGAYTLGLDDKQLKIANENSTEEVRNAWRLNYSYLQKVVDNPEEYINNPSKLDWDWIRNRLGV